MKSLSGVGSCEAVQKSFFVCVECGPHADKKLPTKRNQLEISIDEIQSQIM